MQRLKNGKKADKKLSDILGNNVDGSEDLVMQLNEFILSEIMTHRPIDTILSQAENKLGHFASVNSYLKSIRTAINSNEDIRSFTLTFKNGRAKYYSDIFRNSRPFLEDKNRILTISNSATLIFVLTSLHKLNRGLEIIISESRPIEEGKLMAESFLKAGINVKLITEAMMPGEVNNSDAVVIGADMILKNGDVVNKTGSLLMAITALYYHKPFYVICGHTKITEEHSFDPDFHPASEIWDLTHPLLKIRNYYFERIGKDLISALITELPAGGDQSFNSEVK